MRRALLLAAAVGLAVGAAGAAPAQPPVGSDGVTHLQQLIWDGKPVFCGGGGKRLFALTFDDGPGPYTPTLLAALRRAHAPATFFLVGNRLRYWPQAARAEAAYGSIGNHSWSHARLPGLAGRAMRAQVWKTQEEIATRLHTLSSLFRPPYDLSDPAVSRAAKSLNLLDVRWSIDPGDSRAGAAPGPVVRAVVSQLRPGSIVLLHDTHPWTGGVVRQVVAAARRLHLRPVTIPQLMELDPPGAGCT